MRDTMTIDIYSISPELIQGDLVINGHMIAALVSCCCLWFQFPWLPA